MREPILIACDFDGTVTRQDTLVEVLDTYGNPNWRQVQEKVVSGFLSIREALPMEMGQVKAHFKEIRKLLEKIEVNPSFPPFLRSMREKGIPVVVLSGGFDLFVETVLKKALVWPVPVLANRLFRTNGAWEVEFPFPSAQCLACGHCKGDALRNWNAQGYLTVFVGNGVTDRCAAKEAKLVFAKDELYQWCKKEGIPARAFQDFRDVEQNSLPLPNPGGDSPLRTVPFSQ